MTYINSRGVAMPETEAEQGRVAGTSQGGETMTAPAAPGSSVSGEGGGDVLIGNSYGNRFWITNPNDVVIEQANGGIDTEIGWTSIKLAANVENLQVNGAFNYAYGNDLANLIIVDDNSHWVYGAGGDDVLVGGATARTTFMVRAGEGSDTIYNWNGNDQVQLLNYGFTSANQIRAAMTQQGSDVILKLSASETLTFRGTTVGNFADRQFLLPLDTSKLGAMTFSDEFDSLKTWDPSTQTGTWNTNFGGNLKDPWAYTLPSNGERQVYTNDGFYGQGEQDLGFNPLSVQNGVLTIKAERIPENLRDGAWGREYSSGMINTLGTFEQQYGYFEMKAQLPTAVGTWPAFWLMPTPYTAQTEADIMEALALTPNVDYRRAWGGGENLYDNTLKIDTTGFHTYGMLWTPQTVTFYYDGYAVLQANTPANWTQPMGMILNMAVGGWGGEPNSLQFPDSMKIDYVHVFNLADNSAIIERGTPETPVATLRVDGAQTSGQVGQSLTFDQDGSTLSSAHIAVYAAKPAVLPPGKTFVVYEDAGAVFGAVSDGKVLGPATVLMAGHSNVFTGTGTWLTDGKVALGYMAPAVTGQSAWVMIFDPSKNTFTRHQLGDSTGDIDFVATKNGNFAASWDAPDGTTHARAYDGFAYDGKGWFGPERQITGDLQGYAQNGDLIATSGSAQQLYSVNNPAPTVNAIVSIGPMAGVSHLEGNSGTTAYTFTLTRDFDLSQKSTVGWTVRGEGANPTDAVDFAGGALPSGVATFEINQASTTITILVQGDTYTEGDEQFLVTLVNPVGAKLGQATATGFVQADGDNGGAPPTTAPPASTPPVLSFSNSSLTLAEGNSGSTAFSFTVTRAGSTTGSSTVNWTVGGSGSNPATAADFTGGALPSGTLTFAAGEATKVVTVNVAGDTTVESTEAFTVTLSGATGATLGTATATGTITNDDTATTPPPSSGNPGQVYNSPGFNSTVTAGAGDDTINASQGADVLTGGAGADTFAWAKEPWAPAEVKDFVLGTDKLDLSKLFQASGYTGSDPVTDKYVSFMDDGAGGTKVLFDRDSTATGQQWPNYIIHLNGVPMAGLTWAKLAGTGGATTPPPASAPTVSFGTTSLTLAEGNSGSTAFSFTVTRAGTTTGSSTVNWTVGGTGSNPATAADFTGGALPTGTLTFAAGETSKVVTVNVAGDTTVESNEAFTVTLSGATGATLGTATATGTITNDDTATTPPPSSGNPGQVYNSPGFNSTVTAGAGDDTINASQGADVLTGGAGADTFAWAKEPWAPAEVKDFVLGTDKLDLSKLFQASGYTGSDPVTDKYVSFMDDGAGGTKVLFDRDSTATGQQWPNYIIHLNGVPMAGLTWAKLAGTGGATTPPPASAPTVSFGTTSLTLAEGNSGSTAFSFTVTRAGTTTGSSTVNWTVGGTGSNPATAADFTGGALPTGTLTFAAGETSKVVTVNVAGDTTVESNEAFTVTLSGATGATLGTATATGTITNDDTATTPPPSSGNPGQVYNSPGFNSTVTAGSGDDTINASQGADVLTGGAGADTFAWAKEPWAPAEVKDFVLGTDKLDLSKLFQASGYTGTDPVADKYVSFMDDGAGGTKVLFDRDSTATGQQWPNYIIHLDNVSSTGLTWAKLAGSGTTTTTPPPTTTTPPPAATGTMVVFAGQSNTGGYGTSASNLSTAWHADPKTLIWNDSTHAWEQLNPGVNSNSGYGGNPGGWGPEVQFAIDFRQQHPDEVLRIVKFAEGGTSLAYDPRQYVGDWSPDSHGEHFDHVTQIIANASGAAGGLKPSFVFWGQGEEDGNTASFAQAYGDNLAKLFAAIRDQWMHDTHGDIGLFKIATSPPYSADVRAGETRVDDADVDATSFDTVGFALQSDNLHFAPAGYNMVGDKYFQLYEAARTGTTPPPTTTPPPSNPPPASQGMVVNSSQYGDTLNGGAGADTLNAGQGPDRLTGGAGADVFAYKAGVWNAGHITDFTPGVDKIDLRGLFAQTTYQGTNPVADHWLEFRADGQGNTQVYVDIDGPNGGEWPMLVTTLDHVTPSQIGSGDWIVR